MPALKTFPFAFWNRSIWDSLSRNLTYTEDFGTFFNAIWNPTVLTIQYTEHFDSPWFDATVWSGRSLTLQYTESFNPWP